MSTPPPLVKGRGARSNASGRFESLVREGFDPRALGLFEGHTDGDVSSVVLAPTRIVLFYANLLAACDDADMLSEQIEVTVLHEIGHFFGLDEEGVAALGLA